MTHRAVTELKSAPLSSDFARDFLARKWGVEFVAGLYDRLPLYQRGPRKGQVKGVVTWTKCIKGGWQRTGPSYYGTPSGHVLTPGSHNIRVKFSPYADDDKGFALLELGGSDPADRTPEWDARMLDSFAEYASREIEQAKRRSRYS